MERRKTGNPEKSLTPPPEIRRVLLGQQRHPSASSDQADASSAYVRDDCQSGARGVRKCKTQKNPQKLRPTKGEQLERQNGKKKNPRKMPTPPTEKWRVASVC